jgi:hypothetical protein
MEKHPYVHARCTPCSTRFEPHAEQNIERNPQVSCELSFVTLLTYGSAAHGATAANASRLAHGVWLGRCPQFAATGVGVQASTLSDHGKVAQSNNRGKDGRTYTVV